jgi:hypothetical protein
LEKFALSVCRSLQSYHAKHPELNDPAKLFAPLECKPQSEPLARATKALGWLHRGMAERQAQVILSNYGMGKSFLAQQLMWRLFEQYRSNPERADSGTPSAEGI